MDRAVHNHPEGVIGFAEVVLEQESGDGRIADFRQHVQVWSDRIRTDVGPAEHVLDPCLQSFLVLEIRFGQDGVDFVDNQLEVGMQRDNAVFSKSDGQAVDSHSISPVDEVWKFSINGI